MLYVVYMSGSVWSGRGGSLLLGVRDESVSLMCLVCLLWLYGVVLDVGCGSWALEQGHLGQF